MSASNVQDDYNGIEAVYKNELFQQIKSAWVALHQSPPPGWTFGNPRYDFWEVKSAHTRVGLLQIDGTLHRPNARPVNLMNILTTKTSETFADRDGGQGNSSPRRLLSAR